MMCNFWPWRRLETYALRNAFDSSAKKDKAEWARAALDYRAKRFETMQEAFVDYERGIELVEGTATYVEHKVADTLPVLESFAVTKVRQRGYVTGAAFCFLLDEFAAGWQKRLFSNHGASLDNLLHEALRGEAGHVISKNEIDALSNQAEKDVEQLLRERKEKRASFDNAETWKLTLVSSAEVPLRVEGFDPLNVDAVEGGVLHGRYLKLAGTATRLEVLNAQCLTEAHGTHPLFSGIRSATINLKERPKIVEGEGKARIESDAVNGTVSVSSLKVRKQHIEIVTLDPQSLSRDRE